MWFVDNKKTIKMINFRPSCNSSEANWEYFYDCGINSDLCQKFHNQQSLAGSPPVTHSLNIIVLLSFVWISKSLDVQQWSQMIHLDHVLMKADIWDRLYFVYQASAMNPNMREEVSITFVVDDSRWVGVGVKEVLQWIYSEYSPKDSLLLSSLPTQQ